MISLRKQILTVNVEDYYHVWAIRNSGAVRRKHWDRIDPRLDSSLSASLALLRSHDAKGTFFVFGCIADAQPELIQRIVGEGHEVASRGHWPRSLEGLGRTEFIEDLARAKEALERAGSNPIVGYRSPVWIEPSRLWMLEALAEAGYLYDSSINPILRRFAHMPQYLRPRKMVAPAPIWEFPITTTSFFGARLAISGGNYVRQLPHSLLFPIVARRAAEGVEPVVFYFMPWELDVSQPQISGLSLVNSVRQYRNLEKTRWVFEGYLSRYEFHGIADELGIRHEPLPVMPRSERVPSVRGGALKQRVGQRHAVSLVVPMFNEEQNVVYLQRTLRGFRARLAEEYDVNLILVDDASSDSTWRLLEEHFGDDPTTIRLRHPHNKGVAAAILTGIRAAKTEIVCSIDCDCSYDPSELAQMLPLIADADLVTASPYHPDGEVLNVPPWRLFLSHTLSKIYSVILAEQVFTYTSCCRVYRKAFFADVELANTGFLGVAETLIQAKRRGARVIEFPATLESRLFGESKMRVVRTIAAHLRQIGALASQRVLGTDTSAVPPRGAVAPQSPPVGGDSSVGSRRVG